VRSYLGWGESSALMDLDMLLDLLCDDTKVEEDNAVDLEPKLIPLR
jgi:hypothetical protein